MSFWGDLFGKKKPGIDEGLLKQVTAICQRHTDIINESLKIASESDVIETKLSRLGVAKDSLYKLKEYAAGYSFITIKQLSDVEAVIKNLELQFLVKNYKNIADGNEAGKALEAEGKIEDAIKQYEALAAENVDTPFTYRRLCILYKKLKKGEDELRVLNLAIQNIPSSNAAHLAWFADRKAKLKF
jgi:tetratricopeptide (TPR) repeat protein